MREHVLDISTEAFHVLQRRGPVYVSWSEEKPGPTQRILVEDDVYTELIDRAISKRKSLDQVILEFCSPNRVPSGWVASSHQAFGGRRR
jgi:hypothetical protein